MTPLATVSSPTGTFHWSAAACTSMMRAADSAAASGRHVSPHALAGEVLAGKDVLGRDFLPVALELLGDELGEPRERALPHLRARDADHAGAVGFDDDPGIDLGPRCGCGLGRSDERKLESEREPAACSCRAHDELAA